jgi:hypothetical protein
MFVACRVESEEECKAAAAVLPQIIGNIQTAIGCATLGRASGIAVQAMAGDPVFQGDVIETATDGRIGIRFIDGTVFNLSGGTPWCWTNSPAMPAASRMRPCSR